MKNACPDPEYKLEQEQAVTTLQSGYRGMKARQEVAGIKKERRDEAAATKIQAGRSKGCPLWQNVLIGVFICEYSSHFRLMSSLGKKSQLVASVIINKKLLPGRQNLECSSA